MRVSQSVGVGGIEGEWVRAGAARVVDAGLGSVGGVGGIGGRVFDADLAGGNLLQKGNGVLVGLLLLVGQGGGDALGEPVTDQGEGGGEKALRNAGRADAMAEANVAADFFGDVSDDRGQGVGLAGGQRDGARRIGLGVVERVEDVVGGDRDPGHWEVLEIFQATDPPADWRAGGTRMGWPGIGVSANGSIGAPRHRSSDTILNPWLNS